MVVTCSSAGFASPESLLVSSTGIVVPVTAWSCKLNFLIMKSAMKYIITAKEATVVTTKAEQVHSQTCLNGHRLYELRAPIEPKE